MKNVYKIHSSKKRRILEPSVLDDSMISKSSARGYCIYPQEHSAATLVLKGKNYLCVNLEARTISQNCPKVPSVTPHLKVGVRKSSRTFNRELIQIQVHAVKYISARNALFLCFPSVPQLFTGFSSVYYISGS